MIRGLTFDIRRYSVHDGPGIRTTVFLKGCPLNCVWCHNPEGIHPEPQPMRTFHTLDGKETICHVTVGKWLTASEVFYEIEKDLIFFEESGGGVTFSGGEPLMQPEFLIDILDMCRAVGIHTAVDTSGHAESVIFNEVCKHTDMLLFDIKTTDNNTHVKYTGVDNSLIMQNLQSLSGTTTSVIIRIPVIPGFNDNHEEMEAIRNTLMALKLNIRRIDFLPYHRLGRKKYEALGLSQPKVFKPELNDQRMNELKNSLMFNV
jgi:pyruvate formate lyase activating enzyme